MKALEIGYNDFGYTTVRIANLMTKEGSVLIRLDIKKEGTMAA